MHLYPTLNRNPSSFSMSPVDKSLVPSEQYGTIYGSGRDLYEGTPYTYDVSYTNISAEDYKAIRTFYGVVSTVVPFRFTLLGVDYDVFFKSELTINCSGYNLYNISFAMETCFSSLEIYNISVYNYIQEWRNSGAYDQLISDKNIITYAQCIGDDAYMRSNNLGLSTGSQYTITLNSVLISGALPKVATVNNSMLAVQHTVIGTQVTAGLLEITFTADVDPNSSWENFLQSDSRLFLYNVLPGEWSIETSLTYYFPI